LKPVEQFAEFPITLVGTAGRKRAAQSRSDSRLIRQAVNTDDSPIHVKLIRRISVDVLVHRVD
jgi:hypothetical protein